MRFHSTFAFSQARTAHTAALKAVEAYPGGLEDGEAQRISDAEYQALDTLMQCDAITPSEISDKVKLYVRRGMADWKDSGEDYLVKILVDLKHMQGHPVSPTMRRTWAAWRRHIAEYELAASRSDSEADALTSERDALYVEIAKMDCTTPGDFILKQYLRLLTTLGGRPENPWDIVLGDGQHEARFERADNLGAYADLDACDTGQNLLAYGQPDFDPEAWMEAADNAGLQIWVTQQVDGTRGVILGRLNRRVIMVGEDEEHEPLPEHEKRQRDRLRRLLAFDTERYSLVADEIEREWPQLILRQSSAA